MRTTLLERRGALREMGREPWRADSPPADINQPIDPAILEMTPESVARENLVLPLAFDGETLTLAAADPEDIALADRLRFLLALNVRLIKAPRERIRQRINELYDQSAGRFADSMLQCFTDTSVIRDDGLELAETDSWEADSALLTSARVPERFGRMARAAGPGGVQISQNRGGGGMFFYTVEEGQRVLRRNLNGTIEIISGPRRVWKGYSRFEAMPHFVAHPGDYLVIRYRDGRQEHVPGPADAWFDSRVHSEIETQHALQLAAKEAVVVYTQDKGLGEVSRRIEYGPAMFVPHPSEWLHKFSWHASRGGHQGVQKVPNALVFHKLWLMPDQMYHDVTDVRTSDDAVLTIRLMIFYELIGIEQMLDTTHDPIGDLVNAATADVVEFTGRHDFESFKHNTEKLNELATYRQLTARAAQCGYRINNVVYRGYGAPDSLQQMHDQAIEARTRLQLERDTEQQSQELENYKLDCQLARSGKRRLEQGEEVQHDLELQRRKAEAELQRKQRLREFLRTQKTADAEVDETVGRRDDQRQNDHFDQLRQLGVDLTEFLTQSRADRVIELRGSSNGAHVHLDSAKGGDHSA